MKHNVKVLPMEKIVQVDDGANLRDSLMNNGIALKSPCGGCASCGQCVVIVKEGMNNLNEIPFEEKQLLGNVSHMTGERLSCQTEVLGNIEIDISAHIVKEKKPSTIKRRSKDEYEKVIEERKEKSKSRPERQGGFNKPKAFKDHVEPTGEILDTDKDTEK